MILNPPYPLPYAFARAFQLLLEGGSEGLTLWHNGAPVAGAFGEVLRKHAVARVQQAEAPWLAQRISSAYAQAESSAATVVSEVENDADRSRMLQELPAVAPATSTSSPTSGIRPCAFGWTVFCARWCNPTARCMRR